LLILVAQAITQPVKQLMAIPSVVQGLIETGDGKVFELDSSKGAAWVEAIGSFRFEPSGDGKPCTVRREPSGYWYGCRKVAGKVRKKYIGKTSEVSVDRLEKIAEALGILPVPRVNKVAEVTQEVVEVAQVAQDRLTALELEMADLRKALETLLERLPGKSEPGNSAELPKTDDAVTEQLQNELSNLRTENEVLRKELIDARADYSKLLESSTAVKASREKEIVELRSQLETERADREEIETELSELKQKSAAAREDFPEAADLLNQLKAKRKKSTVSLVDVELMLEMIAKG
jgi:chromosome segregation ATPase